MKPPPTPEEAVAMVMKQRENLRAWRLKNPDKMRAYALAWKRANPEKFRASKREYQRKVYAGYLAAKKAGLI